VAEIEQAKRSCRLSASRTNTTSPTASQRRAELLRERKDGIRRRAGPRMRRPCHRAIALTTKN